MPAIEVNDYIQVAHRLTVMPGPCQQIHGHSMRIFLKLYVDFHEDGYARDPGGETLGPIDYGDIKTLFRQYLKDNYDHRLLLNENDPWAQPLGFRRSDDGYIEYVSLPGLHPCAGDPTTENLAKWISEWARKTFGMDGEVRIEETTTNSVSCGV